MGNDCKKIILNARDSITLDINEPIELNRKRSISMNSTVYSKKFHNVDDEKKHELESSFVNFNYLNYKMPKTEKFCYDLLKEFNYVRTNPLEYSNKIAHHMKQIKIMDNNYIYEEKYGIKLKLINKTKSFIECIEFLKNCQSVPNLEYNKALNIEISREYSKQIDKSTMLEKALSKKKEHAFNNRYFAFHFDKGSVNPETNCVFQLLDDSCPSKLRRSNILDIKFQEVGISVQKVNFKKSYIVYVAFSGMLCDF